MAALSSSDAEDASEVTYGDPGQEVVQAGSGFVVALASVLTHLASLSPGRPNKITAFHSVRAPQLSIYDYLTRISKYFQCSNECFVLSLVYIDRIVKLHPEFTICNLNIHRLLVTSVMLAVKFFDDVYYSNAYYAKVGGIKTKEVNGLETQFLRLIDWRLQVSPQEYDQYRNHVYKAVQGKSSLGPESESVPSLVTPKDPPSEDVRMDTGQGAAYATNQKAVPYPSEDVRMATDDGRGDEEMATDEDMVCSSNVPVST